MKEGRRFRRLFLDPKAVAFGVSVFTFGWVWVGADEWDFHRYIFVAALLLASSVLILIKRAWSNFLAAVLGGYLTVQFAYEFWMSARSAGVPTFSFEHFADFVGGLVKIEGVVALFCGLTVLILACSAHTLTRLESRRETPDDA